MPGRFWRQPDERLCPPEPAAEAGLVLRQEGVLQQERNQEEQSHGRRPSEESRWCGIDVIASRNRFSSAASPHSESSRSLDPVQVAARQRLPLEYIRPGDARQEEAKSIVPGSARRAAKTMRTGWRRSTSGERSAPFLDAVDTTSLPGRHVPGTGDGAVSSQSRPDELQLRFTQAGRSRLPRQGSDSGSVSDALIPSFPASIPGM